MFFKHDCQCSAIVQASECGPRLIVARAKPSDPTNETECHRIQLVLAR